MAGTARWWLWVEQTGAVDVEDLVVEVDLASGEVDLLLDFKDLMADYHSQTRPIGATDPLLLAGRGAGLDPPEHHPYLPDSDSLVVSSRETSTAIKVGGRPWPGGHRLVLRRSRLLGGHRL